MLIQELRSPIYYITREDSNARPLAGAALRAGVGMVQYRAKRLTTREMVQEATALVRMTRTAGVPLVINDRVDVALAVGADGVHVGADDMPVAYARRLMGPAAIIGATAPTPRDAEIAQADGATYVAVGAMYASPTRPDKPVVGVEAVQTIRAATSLPICAIGGITLENLWEVVQGGAELVAVMSAVHDQPDPAAAARELVKQLAASIPHPNHRAP